MGPFCLSSLRATRATLGVGCFFLFLTGLAHAQSPLAYWKFDSTSGTTAIDSSGNNHTATLVNGITWVAGHSGNAIAAQSGKSQYAYVPAINLSNTDAVTVSFWSKRTYSTGGGHVLFESTSNYNDSTTGFGFFPDDNDCDGIQASVHGNSGYTAVCYHQPTSGVWHHFGVVYDKSKDGLGEVTLYIDGVLQTPSGNTYISNNSNAFGNNPLYLFSRGGSSEFDTGTLDEFALYSSALTSAQIINIYKNGVTGTCQLTATPSSITLPTVVLGSVASASGTLSNSCSTAVTITSAKTSNSVFKLSGISTPLTLQPGHSQSYSISYTPTSATTLDGSLTILSNAPADPTLSIPLAATSSASQQAILTASPSSLSFGNVTINSRVTDTVSLTNTGSAALTISKVAVSGSGFSIAAMSLPVTLAAKQSIQVPVSFDPEATSSVTGSLAITSNAQASTTNIPLSGTGIANAVTLSWTDTGALIAGYNVYRSTVSGGSYSKLNAAPVTSPSYTDSGVVAGATYFYEVTAVGQNGMESVYSNKASVVVP